MAAALYLSKLNVNGQEYQIKDANAATAEDLKNKQNVLENYSEAQYPDGGGRSDINLNDGKGYHCGIIVSASKNAGASIDFDTTNGNVVNTLRLNGNGLLLNDETVLVESDLADKVGYGFYDSEFHSIRFYDKQKDGRTELFQIDATDFIKDGMVSDVAISNGNLVITFNTDAGQEPISIALTDIFNPANYYNKTEVDGKLDLKADASNVYTKSEADGKFLTEHQSLADYPTIETMNTALGQKANVSDIYTQTEINDKLAAKANTADLATVATSGSYNDLTDKPVIPEGAVVDAALSDTSENPVQNKVVKGALDAKANSADLATVATSGSYNDLRDVPAQTEVRVEKETLFITTNGGDL